MYRMVNVPLYETLHSKTISYIINQGTVHVHVHAMLDTSVLCTLWAPIIRTRSYMYMYKRNCPQWYYM